MCTQESDISCCCCCCCCDLCSTLTIYCTLDDMERRETKMPFLDPSHVDVNVQSRVGRGLSFSTPPAVDASAFTFLLITIPICLNNNNNNNIAAKRFSFDRHIPVHIYFIQRKKQIQVLSVRE